ncbi:MAG TPA: ATP-dependent RecD-like DNA helicase [Bacilli bacterium]|nr:ATP-dependent RecD-like DNA helicase [Bacilli bacterium]
MGDLLQGTNGQSGQNGREELSGTIKRITYVNEENGYTIASLKAEGKTNAVTVVGTMPGLSVGENVRLQGRWHRHEKFGLQLQVESYERVRPVTREGIEKFLASSSIKGVGPATAKKIVAHFGEETLDILDRTPERLSEVEGIGQVKAEKIARGFREVSGVQSVMLYLGARGVTPALAAKIYKRYGAEAIEVLEQDPYRLVDEVPGVGFKTADKLAQLLGLPPLAAGRLRVGLKHILRQASDDGHVYLPVRELLQKAASLLGDEAIPKLPEMLRQLAAKRTGGVIVEEAEGEHLVYLAGFYFSETKAAERIGKMVGAESDPICTDLSWLDDLAKRNGMQVAPLQQRAVEAVLTERLVVVTGGPGTGKTTTVKMMIAALQEQGITPVLAAPTGRAAKRMTESTGMPAKTLHRLLEYAHVEGEGLTFQRNEEHRLDGRVFIVDEASMLDILLAFQLLRALPDEARLVLVGDIDQLPSVGPGRVLQDIIESERVSVVRLQTIFRQAKESLIVKNAHRINEGLMPQADKQGDFFFLQEGRPEELTALVSDLAARRLPAFLHGDAIEDIQVLVPMRRGAVGVEALNEHLQAALNPPSPDKIELVQNSRTLRTGDKVMQIRNNYQKEVFNGDVGRIRAIDAEEGEVTVEFPDLEEAREVVYGGNELDELVLAYAVTVHKSQGSEYPCVILPLVMQHRVMLRRNLLYTGVTRAKQLVVLVGTTEALRIALRRGDVGGRYSRLGARIRSQATTQR